MMRLAALLRRLADYLDPPKPVLSDPEPNPFHDRIRHLIALVEARFGAGFGEAKRRDVYAQLMKDFPEAKKRDLSFAIEQVLQE